MQMAFVQSGRVDEGYVLEDVHILAKYEWSKAKDLVPSGDFDIDLPDDAEIEAMVRWRTIAGESGDQTITEVKLRTGVSALETVLFPKMAD